MPTREHGLWENGHLPGPRTPPKKKVLANRYELRMLIGKGGMAKIYLARDLKTDQAVVIKTTRFPNFLAASDQQKSMFLHEARVTTLLKHPNIIRMYDLGLEGDHYYMAMEWLVGWDLEQIATRLRRQKRPMPIPIILRLIADACAGLAAVHACRNQSGEPIHLIHRDISPSNLFVTMAGALKLIDFGVAKSALQLQHTRPGIIKGKLAYLSPEQVRCEILDGRSDIFSLGIVFHELVTNQSLFGDRDCLDCFDAIVNAPIAPPQRSSKPIGKALQGVIMRTLQRNPQLRYQSADELGDALKAVVPDSGKLVPREVVIQYLCSLGVRETGAASLDEAGRVSLAAKTRNRKVPRRSPASARDQRSRFTPPAANPAVLRIAPRQAIVAMLVGLFTTGLVLFAKTAYSNNAAIVGPLAKAVDAVRPLTSSGSSDPDGDEEAPATAGQEVLSPSTKRAAKATREAAKRASPREPKNQSYSGAKNDAEPTAAKNKPVRAGKTREPRRPAKKTLRPGSGQARANTGLLTREARAWAEVHRGHD